MWVKVEALMVTMGFIRQTESCCCCSDDKSEDLEAFEFETGVDLKRLSFRLLSEKICVAEGHGQRRRLLFHPL